MGTWLCPQGYCLPQASECEQEGLAGEEPESTVVTEVGGEGVAAVVLAPRVLHQPHCLTRSTGSSSCAEADLGVAAVVLAPPVFHQLR